MASRFAAAPWDIRRRTAAAKQGKTDMTPHTCIRNAWYAAGLSRDFTPGKLTAHKIVGRPIVMWRTREGKVVAFDDRCAHKRFPLSKGRLMEDDTLECAYHGLRYDCTGKCVKVPSQPNGPIPAQAKTNPFPVIEQDGFVWVWPGNPAKLNSCKPPRTPEAVDPNNEVIPSEPMPAPANSILLIENLVDITHFYPLHDGNIGDLENSLIPVQLAEGEVDGNTFVGTIREVKNYAQPAYLVDWFGYQRVDRFHSHIMLNPGMTRVVMRAAPPGQLGTDKDRGYSLLHIHTPIDEHNLIWRWIVTSPKHHMSGGDPTVSVAKRFAASFPDVASQDLWALEQQQKNFAYPDEGYSEVFLKADIAVRRVRKVFQDLLRAEQSDTKAVYAAE
jgi:vanillate O-demethylase monooxygenase subunit